MFDEWRASAVGEGASAEEAVTVPGRPAAFAGADAVTYRTTVADPRDPGDDVAALTLRGLYAHAEVALPGDVVGDPAGEPITHDAYFEPLHVPFEPAGDDELVVTCERPRDRFGGIHDTDAVPAEARVPGIWWEASLTAHALPYVADVAVEPEVTGANARLHVRTTVVTGGPTEERITYSLKPEGDLQTRGMMERATFETDEAGRHTVEHTFDIRDPAFWWPTGLGEQHRYTLQAKLAGSERSVTTGIVDVDTDDGTLVVNDRPVRLRGLNLVTATEADVDRAADLNANLVRAHAQVLPPALYEACDAAGLLVWQDLPLTGPGAFDVDRGRDLAARLGRTYGHHPSLAAFSVHDEPTDTFADGLGGGVLDGLRLRWRAWRTSYDRGPAERVAEGFDADRPVFPVVGGPGTAPDAAAYYPGWDYGSADDIGALLTGYPAPVVAEYGAGALADEAVDAAGFDAAKHAAHVSDGVEASQAYQAEVVGTVAATLRREGRDGVAFALRDTDGAGMGVFTHEGAPKTAADRLRTAFEPVQAFLAAPSPGRSDVVVVNDTGTARSVDVDWDAGDASGSLSTRVGAMSHRTVGSVEVPGDAAAVDLVLDHEDGTVTNRYDL
jgi:hypothetical protein